MGGHPGAGVEAQHRAHEHVPRAGQDHDEGPHPTHLPGGRVEPGPQVPVVDLGLLAGGHVGAQHRDPIPEGLVGELRSHEAAEAGNAHRQAVLVTQPLVHGRHRVGGEHLLDPLPLRVDHPEGQAPGLGVDQLGEPPPDQLGPLRPTQRRAAGGEPRLRGLGHVLAHRLGVDAQAGRHHRLRPAGMPVLQNFNDVDHFELPPCQVDLAPRGARRLQVQGARRVDPSSRQRTRELRQRRGRELRRRQTTPARELLRR